MKVKVIGCSTSWTDRPTSSYCLAEKFLVDCGEGTFKEMKKTGVSFVAITKIFISHFHSDHMFGVIEFIVRHCKNQTKGQKSLTIYGPLGLKRHLNYLKIFAFGEDYQIDLEDYINIVEIKDETFFEVDEYIVKPYILQHGLLTDIAYSFKKDEKVVGFSGDCTDSKSLRNFAQSCDMCFLECCGEVTSQRHLGYDTFVDIKNENNKCKFLAIHCVEEIYNNSQYDIEFAIHGKLYKC